MKEGIIDYTKNLLISIGLTCLLLCLCIAVDYADDNDTITNINSSTLQINNSKIILVNNSSVIGLNDTGNIIIGKSSDKIYTTGQKISEKSKIPTVTITSKPSCGCRYSYTWHTRTYVNYCPNCHRYNALVNKHKWPARFEQELTCKYCDCDWCGCCGKMKYSWSRTYLRRA